MSRPERPRLVRYITQDSRAVHAVHKEGERRHRLLHLAAVPFLGYGRGESNGQNNRISVS